MVKINGKKVLVTGGAGFIGSHLVDELIEKNAGEIVVVDNFFLGKKENLKNALDMRDIKIINQDLSDYKKTKDIMYKESVDVVFDLAVMPLPASLLYPKKVFDTNVRIVSNLCELLKEGAYRDLIHFSSSEAYGTCEYAPMDEKHPLNGITPYAASKSAGDMLIYSYWKTFKDFNAKIIRPFNNYGPRQNQGSYAGVIPLTINRILNGEPPKICGTGKQTRDYIFVTDTAKASIKIYESHKTKNKVLNIASGQELEIGYVIKKIAREMGWEKKFLKENARPGDVKRHIANIVLARETINFSPTTPFEEGIRKTIQWYKEEYKSKH